MNADSVRKEGGEKKRSVCEEMCASESNPKPRPQSKPSSADVAERGVASISVRSQLCDMYWLTRSRVKGRERALRYVQSAAVDPDNTQGVRRRSGDETSVGADCGHGLWWQTQRLKVYCDSPKLASE